MDPKGPIEPEEARAAAVASVTARAENEGPAGPSKVDARADGLAGSAIRGAAWVGVSRLSGKLLFFASTIILARLLEQDDFGVAAYAITVIALIGSVPSLGVGPALIYHRDDRHVLSTGFWIGIAMGLVSFALIWGLAPYAELLFGDERAVSVTRALALVFPIESLRGVHTALLRKRLAFRRRFVPELVQSITKGGVSIGLALAGFGPFSLIYGVVAAAVVSVPAYWVAVHWRPTLHFDAASARRLLSFGGHVVGVGMLGALVRNLDYLLVGRMLGAATLGVYVLAFRIPDLLIRNLSVTLGQVLFPVYARMKDDPVAVRETFLATTSYVFAVTAPIAVGLAVVAEPLVLTVFSEKWIEVVPVMLAICFYALCISLAFNLGDLYKALGRPDVLTRLSLVRAVVVVPALWFAASSVGTAAAVAWAQAGVALFVVLMNFTVAHRLFGLPVLEAGLRLLPVAAAAGLMALATLAVGSLLGRQPAVLQLGIEALVGAAVYLSALRLLARDFFEDGFATLRASLRKKSARAQPVAAEGAR